MRGEKKKNKASFQGNDGVPTSNPRFDVEINFGRIRLEPQLVCTLRFPGGFIWVHESQPTLGTAQGVPQ